MFVRKYKFNAVIPIIIVNIICYIIQLSVPGFTESFMLVSEDIYTRPWIVVTSMFLHSPVSIFHLFFNMYALLLFGTLIEQRIGTKRFLMLYFGSGILAASIPFYHAALGASGAIMGVLGMTIMLFPHMKVLFFFFIPMSMRTAGIIFAAIDIFGLVSPVKTGIAHYAHLIGLICGLVYGYYLLKKQKEFVENFTQKKSIIKKKSDRYDDTIELSKEEMDNYLKYGRL
jgi:uncharacterized protein